MPQSTSSPTEPRPAPGRARPNRPGAPEKKQLTNLDRDKGMGRDRASSRPDPAAEAAGWVVYLLRCADGTIYCGCTNDLVRRLGRHQRGDVKYTRGRLPVEVAYSEEAGGRGEALRREAALKRLPRGRKLRLCATQTEPASQPAGKAPRKTPDMQPDKPRSAARKL